MARFDRQVERNEKKHPYRMLDHLLRKQVPDAMAEYGLESTAIPLRNQPELLNETQAYLGVQSLAAVAITHAALAFRALELMDEDQRATLLAQAPALEQVMEALT